MDQWRGVRVGNLSAAEVRRDFIHTHVIILQALGFPTDMFTVLFAIGRAPGWLAHWKEIAENGKKIHRPRQIYQGSQLRPFIPILDR